MSRPMTTPSIRGWTFVEMIEERNPPKQDRPRGEIDEEGEGQGGQAEPVGLS